MNYGCGSSVHPRDLVNQPTIANVGVGGGMELLQFSYFSRRKGSIIGIDIVPEMLEASKYNFKIAEATNEWFHQDFIDLKKGSALDLPPENESVDIAAQNCLFNIFKTTELKQALCEMYRVPKPHGRLILSDPICENHIPEFLRNDNQLRAICISGSLPLNEYIQLITEVGFGTVESKKTLSHTVTLQL